jgi:serine/threonine protein kinase
LILVTKVNDMEEFLSNKLGKGDLTVDICEEQGLKLFDNFYYKELETLGKGAFGVVLKCMQIEHRDMVAVKIVQLNSKSREKMIQNLGSYFVETEILKKVHKIFNPNIACLKNNFYIPDEKGVIQSLVLVTEAGDFSLSQLVKCRKANKKNPPYSPSEALKILIPLAKAYRDLQKHRVYHSDTKLENIVYSVNARKFIIIDFGVSNVMPQQTDEIEISYLVRGGTPGYDSPEKSLYLTDPSANCDQNFNPFKCDMWSLGICLEKMCCKSDATNHDVDDPFLKRIIAGLKEKEWKKRLDAKQLCEILSEYEKDHDISLGDIEKPYLEVLRQETWDRHPDLINLYSDAQIPLQVLEMALHRKNQYQKTYGEEITSQNWSEYDLLLTHLGCFFIFYFFAILIF